ncbi:MAG: radical SAM family heme chaperone HemW [Alphaproteobacteria bacterium]
MSEPAVTKPLGNDLAVYIHWPFCLSKCPYCDFNSHVGDAVDHDRWRRALLAEMDHFAAQTHGRMVKSIFFGGGTPSLMAPATVAALIERADRHWTFDPHVEITLEANPGATETERLAGFRAAGINRVSIGVQALDDAALKFLGRVHDSREAIDAVERAHRLFSRVSFDLIYGRPAQSVADWKAELARALDLAGEHLSLYQLTIEPGTVFHGAHRRGAFTLPDEDRATDLFDLTQEMTDAAGLPAYEISNHARPGSESRHNLVYWQGEDYAGIGPGAHGRLTLEGKETALSQIRAPRTWLDAVEKDGHATTERRQLDQEERVAEILLMGLRLAQGIDGARFLRLTGRSLEETLLPEIVERLGKAKLITCDEHGLRATPAGRLVLNSVIAALVP